MIGYGCQNMVDPIQRVLLKHPKEAFQNQKKTDQDSSTLNYLGKPNYTKAINDYELFLKILKSFDIDIHFLPTDNSTSLDSIYTHDPCIISNAGVILCSMGKHERHDEPNAFNSYFNSINVPILGKIKSPGILEGGDVSFLDERTVAIGEGYRSNAEGIRQLKFLLDKNIDEIIPVPLPHWTGSKDCLHLMSNISPIDHDLFLVYSRLLSVPFRKYLLDRKIQLIEVPDQEYDSMGCNVLAVAPRKVIMIDKNPITKKRLEQNGVEVHTYDGTEISIKGSGGPTCLTRPFVRSVL